MSEDTAILIGDKYVGNNQPVFIIAEAGVNHNGELELAKKLVDVAVGAGADAVKFQTFTAELLVTKDAEQAEYQTENIGKKETHYEILKRLELKRECHPILQEYCASRGIIFLSTPFSEVDADFLETLNVPAFKTSSGDVNNLPFLKHLARKGKPLIYSTGMSDMAEVESGVTAMKEAGNSQIIVLHCTANYPPTPESLNLRAIESMRAVLLPLGIPVGYSDNGSEGIIADIAAVSLGACLVEKHFTLDKNMVGPDHKASLSPLELKEMVTAIRLTKRMLGDGVKRCMPEEVAIKAVGSKSLIAARDIPADTVISRADVIIKRPGTGIPPTELDSVLGKKAKTKIVADSLIQWSDLL